ncbi:MAG: N-acetyltransferase [Bacteroidales bacterium]
MVTVKAIDKKKDLKQFVQFRTDLYKDSPYAVPALFDDELNTLTPEKNPAGEFCDFQCFLAYKNDKVVGRICAIINNRANEIWKSKSGRIGFFDFIDDEEVSDALISTAEDWIRSKGMTEVHGPLGFTDMDPEGMLIEGFDQLGTMAAYYNYDYYPKHIERLGYTKDADWVEFKVYIPDAIPDKHKRIADIVQKKYELKLMKFKKASQIIDEGWGRKFFELINMSYGHLYGFTPLTDRQIDHYVKMYVPILRPELVTLIADKDNNLVCVGVALPSLSKALQKSKGKLFPFGFIHLLKALKTKAEICDLMLVAVHPEYQNKGVNALLFTDLIPQFQKLGTVYAESNPELEENGKVQAQWDYFKTEQHKRRRAYKKELI